MKAFMTALDSMGKDPLEVGLIPPTPDIVNKFFNDSTGENEMGDKDMRGPWNEGDDIEYVEAPARIEASVTAEEVTQEVHKATRGGRGRGNSDGKVSQARSKRLSR
jgi:Mn-containing catalase